MRRILQNKNYHRNEKLKERVTPEIVYGLGIIWEGFDKFKQFVIANDKNMPINHHLPPISSVGPHELSRGKVDWGTMAGDPHAL